MDYSEKTQELIERQCRNVERKDFFLDKEKGQELVMQTYDLFNLPRPKKVVWFSDLSSEEWNNVASSAWFASFASSASSAWFASSAWSASSASSARFASFASSALDYDFDWYVFAFEYAKNPTDSQPNEHDNQYLQYCELLMQAKENGVGYRIEWEDTLYLVPSPVVRLNEDTPPQYSSDQKPAIEWLNGEKFYYLDGVNFSKELWERVISKEMSLSEIMKIEISDQRTVALKYNPQAIIKEKAKLIHKDDRTNELYLVENSEINTLTNFPKMYFVKMTCPTGRIFIEGIPPEVAEETLNATDCQAWLCGLVKSDYQAMQLES